MEILRDPGFSVTYDSQKIFRILLDCMARPGKINQLPHVDLRTPRGANPYILVILRTLLDQQVSFAVIGGSHTLRESVQGYLAVNTGSPVREVAEADFIYAMDGCSQGQVLDLKRGSHGVPEEGTTIIYHVVGILPPEDGTVQSSQGSSATYLSVSGPGIQDGRRVGLCGPQLADEVVDLIKTREFFPLGVEAIFVEREGKVIALPRSTKVEVQM